MAVNPMSIDLTKGTVAAFASSVHDGRNRWSDLAVWHVPGASRPWVAQALGHSDVPGERTKERRLASASLYRALRLFDDSDMGVIVKETAVEWAEENGVPLAPKQFVPATDHEALAMLLGDDGPSSEVIERAADALGHVHMRHGEILVPISSIYPFIDRAAFQREVLRNG